MTSRHIPFEVETSRIIELLAKQIYQSPLALLRENVQNAFDAIRERMQVDCSFDPKIDITVNREKIIIEDNGIGMSSDELKKHFWTAGSSSKNTVEARAAGVVGTFGIGAMANFGVAHSLIVETESARSGERTISIARRDQLSLKKDCVELIEQTSTGNPGTRIIAELSEPGSVDSSQASTYVRDFVRLVDVPVFLNGILLSQVSVTDLIPDTGAIHRDAYVDAQMSSNLKARVEVAVSSNAVIRLYLKDLYWNEKHLQGYILVKSGQGALQTARSGFGLAIVPVSSTYGFGGIADLLVLEPTAGREAVTSDGVQLLQAIMNIIDRFVSENLARLDQCNASTPFMQWVAAHGRYDLMGKITIEVADRQDATLADIADLSLRHPVAVYGGTDPGVIQTFSSEESRLLIYSRTNPRRQCQESYISRIPSIRSIPDAPTVSKLEEGLALSGPKWSVAFRLESIIIDDYFVEVSVAFGQISHGVAVLLTTSVLTGKPQIILGLNAANIITLLQVYETHIDSFRSLAKDFVRTVIFPRISHLVPSSTRQGAQAFLDAMRKKRETFEYDDEEQDELPSIWEDYKVGKISLENAIDRSKFSVRTSVQYVENVSTVRDVVPDLLENELVLADQLTPNPGQAQWYAEPAILRTSNTSNAKLITVDTADPDLRGYRCFIALAPRAYADFGDFFTQPHSTSVVWGGQKTLFIFIHHSGEFGIYYDMQASAFVGEHAGGGAQRTCTIILKDKIYIPIPPQIQSSFIPTLGEKKRFEIKADLIRTGQSKSVD